MSALLLETRATRRAAAIGVKRKNYRLRRALTEAGCVWRLPPC